MGDHGRPSPDPSKGKAPPDNSDGQVPPEPDPDGKHKKPKP